MAPTDSRLTPPPDWYRFGRLAAALVVCCLPALVDADIVRRVSDLNPFFAPDAPSPAGRAALLFLWTPVVVTSASILFLAPGLLLALALGAGRSVATWVSSALALSIVVVSGAATLAQAVLGAPLRGAAFAAVVVACVVAAVAVLALRYRRAGDISWPLASPHAGFTLASLVVVPATLFAVTLPKFFWEDFNGDGVHTFEAVRLLLTNSGPFFPSDAIFVTYPGVRTILVQYPISWYVRFFGECEASVRVPFLLFFAGLYAAVLAAVEYARAELVGIGERALLWVGLTTFAVVMAYSATYNLYHADIALPATQDALVLALFFGFALSHARGDLAWAGLFLALTYTCSPIGLMLAFLWLGGSLVVVRSVPWRSTATLAALLGACIVAERVAPAAMTALGLWPPGEEHSMGSLASRFTSLQARQWRRIALILVPSGILPALALLAWRRQDSIGRLCALLAAANFAIFYFQRKSSVHYYAPAMVLPLVTFWRLDVWSSERLRRPALAAAAVAAVVALVVSLPREASVYNYARLVGSAVEDRVEPRDAHDLSGYARAELLHQAIPPQVAARVPAESFGEGAIVLYYYRARGQRPGSANYVLQRADDAPPDGARRAAEANGIALYVRDAAVLSSHLALRPPLPYGSRLYDIPKGSLFAP